MLLVTPNEIAQARARAERRLADAAPACDPLRGERVAELAFRRKCLNELAFYLLWRERLGIADGADTHRLRAAFAAHASADYADLACRSPKRVLMFSTALGYALGNGLLDRVRAERVAALLSGAFAWHSEWPAFRQLDLLVACDFAGVRGPLAHRDVLAVSSLAVPPCPIYSDRDGFFALCHTAAYGALLGTPPDPSAAVAEAIDGGLCRALASHDLDLGLELVLATFALGIEPPPAAALLLDELFGALGAAGALPPPAIPLAAVEDFLVVRPQERAFAESFHATIVAALVLALMEARGIERTTAPARERAAFAHGIGEAFLALHAYSLVSGLSLAAELRAATAPERAHLRRIARFVASLRHEDGRFGMLVEERAFYRAAHPGGDFEAAAGAHVDAACARFLTLHPAGSEG